MAIEQKAPPILILNGIPITLKKDYCYIENVTCSTNSSVNIFTTNQEKAFFKLGSGIKGIYGGGAESIVQRTIIETKYNIELIIENQGYGAYITDLITPLLQAIVRVINMSSQFIYNSYYMIWGYLENYNISNNLGENTTHYSLSFVENIHRTYADETLSPDIKKVEENIIGVTKP